MKKLKILVVLVLIFSFQINIMLAQDIHHSQFYTSPLNTNPALTGVFNGDWRAAGNYRSQWFVDNLVNYLTFTGSYDIRLYPKKWTTKGLWSAGFLVNYDRAGDSKLSLGYIGISASYAYPINKNNIFSIGGLIGGAQRRFQQDQLTWDEQWNGTSFDPNLSPQENFDRTSNGFLDLSAGINYRWQKNTRTKIDAGLGLFHLNQPEQQFFSQTESVNLPIRFNLSFTPSVKLLERLDLLLHAQFQKQQNYQETVFGGYGKFYLSLKRGREFALLLGLSARSEDAIIPKLAFQYNNWYGGISYDVNTSPFDLATRGRGGPEFSLIYTYVKSRPLSQLKACPIF